MGKNGRLLMAVFGVLLFGSASVSAQSAGKKPDMLPEPISVDIAEILSHIKEVNGAQVAALPRASAPTRLEPAPPIIPVEVADDGNGDTTQAHNAASDGGACGRKVDVSFSDVGHVVTYGGLQTKSVYEQLQDRMQKRNPRVGGLQYEVGSKKEGCTEIVTIKVFRDEPIKIPMQPRRSGRDCFWNAQYMHALEHVRILLETPKSFKEDIQAIGERSTNPSAEMVRMIWKINQEADRRRREFSNFEKRIKPANGCLDLFKLSATTHPIP